jgi:hypothetical protein
MICKAKQQLFSQPCKFGVDLLMGCKCQSNAEVKEVILLSHTENGSGKFMDSLGVVPDIRAFHEKANWEVQNSALLYMISMCE